jgi:hypothetical protein
MFFSAIATNQTTGMYFPLCLILVQDRTGCFVKAKSQAEKHEAADIKERIVMISWAKACLQTHTSEASA